MLSKVAKEAGDVDWQYPLEIVEGVPLGVDSAPLPCEHVWPTKEEMSKCPEDQEPGEPCSKDNYTSAGDFDGEIEATFEEEKEMDMTLGPMSLESAAIICECEPDEICCGALAGINEGDKIRTVHDGTISTLIHGFRGTLRARQHPPVCMTCCGQESEHCSS